MKEFANSVDKFSSFNEYKILDGKEKISKEKIDKKVLKKVSLL